MITKYFHRLNGVVYFQKKHFLCALIMMHFTMLQAQPQSAPAPGTNPVGAIPGVIDVSPMGAATYTIPIEVVSGTQGMQPSLSVVYNSFGGMGLPGMKWNLAGLSAITRCGQTPYYDDNITGIQFNGNDRFAIDGNRLLQISNGIYGGNGEKYATEMENFTRVFSYGKLLGPPAYFIAYTDDGSIIKYGTSDNSRQFMKNSSNILSWLIDAIEDFNGNYMSFHYDRPNNDGEILISEIQYAGNTSAGISTYAKVTFGYDIALDMFDNNTRFISGYALSPQKRLLTSITVSYKDTVVRKYEFRYNTNVTGERTAHLNEVVLYGEGVNPPQLNATLIKWGDNYSTFLQKPITGFPSDFPDGKLLPGDFNGDGYTDFVVYDINWSGGKSWKAFIYNSENGTYEQKASGIYTSEDNNDMFFAQEINEDGKDELIVGLKKYNASQRIYYHEFTKYKIKEGGGTTTISIINVDNFNNIVFGDFDGDGSIETIYVTGTVKSAGGNAYNVNYVLSGVSTFPIEIDEDYYGTGVPKLYVDVLDFNGNGKKNIKATLLDKTKIYEFNGSSFETIFSSGPQYDPHYNAKYTFYGDVNGDGISDILVCEYWKNRWLLFIAKGDGTYIENDLGDELDIVYSFQTNELESKIRFVDINGDGKEDIIQGVKVGSTTTFNILLSDGCINGEYKWRKTTMTDIAGHYEPLENWSVGDYNGDGRPDIILKNNKMSSDKPKVIFCNQDNNYEYVQEIEDGIGKKIELNYKHKYLIAKSKHNTNNPPYNSSLERKYFLPIVESLQVSNGIGTDLNILQYQYNVPVYSSPKGTFLGFNEFICINNLNNKRDELFFNFQNYGSSMVLYNTGVQMLIPAFQISYCGNQKTVQRKSPATVEFLEDGRFVFNTGDIVNDYLANTYSVTHNYLNDKGQVTKSITKTYHGSIDNLNNLQLTEEKTFTYQTLPLSGNQNKTVLTKTITTQQYGSSSSAPTLEETATFGYFSSGRLDWEQKSNADGFMKTNYGNYNNAGAYREKTVTATGCQPRKETYEYDPTSRFVTLVKNFDFPDLKTYFSYDSKTGNKTREKDPNGLITTWKYDSFGNLTQVNYPDGTQTHTSVNWFTAGAYPPNAKYYTFTTSTGKYDLTVYYDILGRELCRKEGGNFFETRYNNKGQVVMSSGPFKSFPGTNAFWHNFTYDDYGRKLTEKGPYTEIEYIYSFGSRKVMVKDHLRNKIQSWKSYDALGRIDTAYDAGGTIIYNYSIITQNSKPRHQTKITANGATTTIVSDLNGNRLSITEPNAGEIKSAYNGFGELVAQIDARDNITSYLYDKLGRVTQKQYTDKENNSQTITYTYDHGSKGKGKLYQMNMGAAGSELFEYDTYGRLSQHQKIIDRTSYFHKYYYNTNGQLEKLTYPSNFAVKYSYSSTGELSEIRRGDDDKLIYKVITRNKFHSPVYCEYGNGVATVYTCNPQGMVTHIQTGNQTDGVPIVFDEEDPGLEYRDGFTYSNVLAVDSAILNYRYAYDNKGLMVSRSESVLNLSEAYQYDNLDRLVQVTPNLGAAQTFQYAGNGNIAMYGAGAYSYGSNSNKPHAVTKVTNAPSGSASAVIYNFFNQPTQITEGIHQLDLFYDAGRQRWKIHAKLTP